jgi:hypothetical protein
MEQDLVVRGLSAHTQRAYLFVVSDLTRYHRRLRPADELPTSRAALWWSIRFGKLASGSTHCSEQTGTSTAPLLPRS